MIQHWSCMAIFCVFLLVFCSAGSSSWESELCIISRRITQLTWKAQCIDTMYLFGRGGSGFANLNVLACMQRRMTSPLFFFQRPYRQRPAHEPQICSLFPRLLSHNCVSGCRRTWFAITMSVKECVSHNHQLTVSWSAEKYARLDLILVW